MNRRRFHVICVLVLALSYGGSWLVVRESFRGRPDAGEMNDALAPVDLARVDRLAEFRRIVNTETDLVRGTRRLADIIAKMEISDCNAVYEFMDGPHRALRMPRHLWNVRQAAHPVLPLWHQTLMLARYRVEQLWKESGAYPLDAPSNRNLLDAQLDDMSLDAIAKGPLPLLHTDIAWPSLLASAASYVRIPIRDDMHLPGRLCEEPVGPVEWALVWLDRRSPAQAFALFNSMGRDWQEDARYWLADFLHPKGIAAARLWLEEIQSPFARHAAAEALLWRWAPFERDEVWAWAHGGPEQRKVELTNFLQSSVQETMDYDLNTFFNEVIADTGASNLLNKRDWVDVMLGIRSLDHDAEVPRELLKQGIVKAGEIPFEDAATESRSRRMPNPSYLAYLAFEGKKFRQRQAVAILEMADHSSIFSKPTLTATLLKYWAATRKPDSWGPYENGLLWMSGLPILPLELPLQEMEVRQ